MTEVDVPETAEHAGHGASLDAFFASCPEMLFVAGVDGALVRWSAALGRALGAAVEQGTSFEALVHPEDEGALAAAWARLREGAEPVAFDVRLLDADRAYRPLSCSASLSPERDAVYGSLRPAPARGGVADERSLKEQLLDSLAENMSVCIWAIDPEGVFIYHDGKGLAKAGLRRGQFLGMNIFELYAGGDTAEVHGALEGQAAHTVTQAHGVHWESWIVPVRDALGEVTSVLGFTLDISSAKAVEAELQARIDQIEKQQEVIRSLSTPIIEVWEGVLTLPMVGVVDSVRTAEVMDTLLARISETQARFAILDLTGVEVVDTRVANHLLQLVTAIRLLGAEGIVAGIKPNVAQTMVAIGLDLTKVITQRNLRAALHYCLARSQAGAAGPRSR